MISTLFNVYMYIQYCARYLVQPQNVSHCVPLAQAEMTCPTGDVLIIASRGIHPGPAGYKRVSRDTSVSRGIRETLARYERLPWYAIDYRGIRSTPAVYERLSQCTGKSLRTQSTPAVHRRLPRHLRALKHALT